MDGRQWRVWHRWSPRGCDLALLHAVDARPAQRAVERRGWRLARRGVLRAGSIVEFYGFTGRRFELRRATVMAVTATRAVANVRSPAGVAAGDSGGPAFVNGKLAGIVIARTGLAVSPVASTQVVLARLDRGRRLPLRS